MSKATMVYKVQSGDTLSGIAQRHGTSIHKLQKINGIKDPDRIRTGQIIALKAEAACKVDVMLLDRERNPIKNARMRLNYCGKNETLTTGKDGRLSTIQTDSPNDMVGISIARMNGTWKKISEVTSDWGNKLVTLVSPKTRFAGKTMPHPKDAYGLPMAEPKRTDRKPVHPPEHPETTKAKGKSHGNYGDGKGPKTKKRKTENGLPFKKVTNDQVKLDFLGGYTGEKITEEDYKTAAMELGCEVAAIRAVAEVETRQRAFDKKNRPTILYERHKFAEHTYLANKYNTTNPDISSTKKYTPKKKTKDGDVIPNSNRYGALGDHQYKRLAKAYALDKDAALKACSWGKFQIMGFNHKKAGFSTVLSYVQAMCISEKEHLKAFVNFINAKKFIKKALANKEWTAFANLYNGKRSNEENNYDAKMKEAYNKYAK